MIKKKKHFFSIVVLLVNFQDFHVKEEVDMYVITG